MGDGFGNFCVELTGLLFALHAPRPWPANGALARCPAGAGLSRLSPIRDSEQLALAPWGSGVGAVL